MDKKLNSSIYVGGIRHRRFTPIENNFKYRVFMMYLDLDELESVFNNTLGWSATNKPALAWFKRNDYLRPEHIKLQREGKTTLSKDAKPTQQPLSETVRDLVALETGKRPAGPIRMLTNLRYFGIIFNPVTFYYCFDRTGNQVENIVAQINNTPWNERFYYLLPCDPNTNKHKFNFDKEFHVSPFNPMEMQYSWFFNTPDQHLNVHMANYQDNTKHFDATLKLEKRPITASNLQWLLVSYPFMTLKVAGGIYWQALKLMIKRSPFYTNPSSVSSLNQEELSNGKL